MNQRPLGPEPSALARLSYAPLRAVLLLAAEIKNTPCKPERQRALAAKKPVFLDYFLKKRGLRSGQVFLPIVEP